MSAVERKRLSALVVVVGVLVGLLAFVGVNEVLERPASAARAAKHTICHRTRAVNNPYRLITVSRNAIFTVTGNSAGNFKAGHANHTGPTYSAGVQAWGDIIPPFRIGDSPGVGNRKGKLSQSLNWTGQAWDDGSVDGSESDPQPVFVPPSMCTAMTAKQFMLFQSQAGATVEEIMDDLEEQGAVEDLAVKQSLGGSFSGWYDAEVSAGRTPTISSATAAVEAAEPAVTTKPAGSIASTTATLKAEVDPQGTQMSFYFQLSSSSAGVSSATPASSGMKIAGQLSTQSNSSTPVQVELPVSALQTGTHYFRIVGEVTTVDSAGEEVVAQYLGQTLSFQVGVPSVSTNSETNVTRNSATLNGEAMPNGVSHTYSFEYSTSANFTSSTTLSGAAIFVNGVQSDASSANAPVSVTTSATGLTPATTYYYRIIGVGSSTLTGATESFTTLGNPTGATRPESGVSQTSATLNGTVSPNGIGTDLYFQWSTTSAGVASASTVSAGMAIGGQQGVTTSASVTSQNVSMAISSLEAGTTYYYRLLGFLASDGSLAFEGQNEVFTTLGNPTGSTEPETGVTQTSATLRGSVTPNGVLTELFFQWATTSAGVTNSAEANSAMSIGGSAATTSASMTSENVSMSISGLTAGTTYYFRLIGKVGGSIVFAGVIEDFTTNSPGGQGNNGNQGPPGFVPSTPTSGPSTTVGRQGPPAQPNGGGSNGGNGNGNNSGNGGGGPQPTDPRTGNSEPIEQNVNVQVGPNLPGGGGGGGGSIRIAPQENEPPLELLDANIDDPEYEIEVVRSGTDYNKPETWVKDGFGDECWKIEPGGSSYVLPNPPTPPSGKAGAVYSAIKVKAGSLTSDDPNFQVNTVFLDPAPGTMVWPDSNKDGTYNPGGRTGDKDISHIILCVRYGGSPTPTTAAPATVATTTTTRAPSTTAAPATTTTTRAPSTTAAPTTAAPTTAAPTTSSPNTSAAPTTATPNTTAAPTTTRAPSTTAAPTTAPPTTAAPTTATPTTSLPNTTAAPTTSSPNTTAAPTTATPAIPTTSVPEEEEEIEIDIRRKQELPTDSTTTTADGPRNRKITLVVTNGLKQSTLELVVDLDRFVMVDGNVPLPTLPKTGSTSNQPIQLALATIAFGTFLVVIRRRLRNV